MDFQLDLNVRDIFGQGLDHVKENFAIADVRPIRLARYREQNQIPRHCKALEAVPKNAFSIDNCATNENSETLEMASMQRSDGEPYGLSDGHPCGSTSDMSETPAMPQSPGMTASLGERSKIASVIKRAPFGFTPIN